MSQSSTSTPVVWWQRWGGALGFHVPMLAFALRTSVAAFVALAVAYAMGLEHPHWAAMSAWASSQPLREHLLSRSIYRFGGSVAGVVYAVALVLLAQDSLWVLALGLALGGAVCAFFGNLQRGYMVYGWMLAGYSAAMVVLLHHGPADAIWPFAWDRMFTVITGVLAALAISWCFAPRRKAQVLIAQNRQAVAGVLQAVAGRLQHQPLPKADYHALLSQLAAVEELLEVYPEGSRTARHATEAMHWQQHHALDVVYHLGQTEHDEGAPGHPEQPVWTFCGTAHAPALEGPYAALAHALQTLVQTLKLAPSAESTAALQQAVRHAVGACEAAVAAIDAQGEQVQPGLHALHTLLQSLRTGLHAEARDLQLAPAERRAARRMPLALHRDWVGARQAAVRAGGTLLVVGVLWAWTEANIVGFAMLGLATMLLVFSSFESPSRTMAFVLRGQLIGAGLALLCQSVVWPLAQSSAQMVWMLLPFALIAGLVFAHKRTAAGAMDTNMAMFILLAPVFPDTAGFGKHLSYALAVVSGPALAWVMYKLIYPTNAHQRLKNLASMMLQEVPALARRLVGEAQPARWSAGPASHGAQWLGQLHHRLLRLVRSADKQQWPARQALPRTGLSLRAMQTSMLQLQQWRCSTIMATPALRRTQRQAQLALHRTAAWGSAGNEAVALRKAQAAWQALAEAPALPVVLAAQAQRIAQRDLVVLQHMRQQVR